MNTKPLRFENPDNTGRRLRCPECGEYIDPQDVETLTLCPYCGAKLKNGEEIEDFAIDPLVRQWVERNKF